MPRNYVQLLNTPRTDAEEALKRSEAKNIPFSGEVLMDRVVKKYGIEQVLHPVGRSRSSG